MKTVKREYVFKNTYLQSKFDILEESKRRYLRTKLMYKLLL